MTKSIITRESCKKELEALNRSTLFSSLSVFIIVFIISIPLAIACIYFGFTLQKTGVQLLLSIYFLVLGILLLIPAGYIAYQTYLPIKEYMLLKNNEFSIVIDSVSELNKNDYHYLRRHLKTITFSQYGKYVARDSDFYLASVGNEYLVVIYNMKKPSPKLVYKSENYEFKG